MMKCKVRPAVIEDLDGLSELKISCTRENYRGFFEFAPLNEQSLESTSAFFLKMLANPDARVFLLENQQSLVGYGVVRKVENEQGRAEGEILAMDVLPNVSMDGFHTLIIAALESIVDKDIHQVFIYLLNNNFKTRFVFEHIGFKKDGAAITQLIQEERFELLRYVYQV